MASRLLPTQVDDNGRCENAREPTRSRRETFVSEWIMPIWLSRGEMFSSCVVAIDRSLEWDLERCALREYHKGTACTKTRSCKLIVERHLSGFFVVNRRVSNLPLTGVTTYCNYTKLRLVLSRGSQKRYSLKAVQRPEFFAVVCFCCYEFRTVSYSRSCGKHVTDFTQSMLVFGLPLNVIWSESFIDANE